LADKEKEETMETKNKKKKNKIKRIDAKGLCATCLTDRSSEIIFFFC
jgi:hypothetical protein